MNKLFCADNHKNPFLIRIAAVLASVLLLLVSVFLILFSLNVFGEERIICWIRAILGDLRIRILLIAASLVSVLLCISVLRPRGKRDDPLRNTALISRSDAGGTFISLSAIKTMVDRFLDSQPHIQSHESVVQNGAGGIRIDLRLVVSDGDIAVFSEKLHTSLDEYIGSIAGIPVKSIRILIDEADIPAPEPDEKEDSGSIVGAKIAQTEAFDPIKELKEDPGVKADLDQACEEIPEHE